MNILHIITHYYPHVYGAENFALHIAESQAKQNEVHVLTGKWNPKWPSYEQHNGVHIHRVPVIKIRFIQTILATLPFFRNAIKLHIKHEFAVIHSHIFPSLMVNGLLKNKFKSHAPKLITTIQGGDLGDYPEVFGPPITASLFKRIIAWSLKKVDKVHCVSTYLANEVKKMGVDEGKITVIPNGVDTKKFLPSTKPKPASTIKFVTTSRLEDKNNLVQLIEVINELRKNNHNVTLDIYGTGSLRQRLKKLIQTHNLTKYVQLKGYINNSDLPKVLPNYQFFIRLSKQEGFGISFIEAMACGLIPIGTPVGGITDIIKDGKNGYLIDIKTLLERESDTQVYLGKSSQAISVQIEKILSQAEKWPNIANQARKTTEERFDWKEVIKLVERVYGK